MNSKVLSNGNGSTYPHNMANEKVESAILRSSGNRLLHIVEIIGLDGLACEELSNILLSFAISLPYFYTK